MNKVSFLFSVSLLFFHIASYANLCPFLFNGTYKELHGLFSYSSSEASATDTPKLVSHLLSRTQTTKDDLEKLRAVFLTLNDLDILNRSTKDDNSLPEASLLLDLQKIDSTLLTEGRLTHKSQLRAMVEGAHQALYDILLIHRNEAAVTESSIANGYYKIEKESLTVFKEAPPNSQLIVSTKLVGVHFYENGSTPTFYFRASIKDAQNKDAYSEANFSLSFPNIPASYFKLSSN